MKKRVGIFLIICLLLITGCSTKKEKLVLATEASFPPFEYYENGKIVGVDIDIAKEIANALDMELEIKDVYFDSIISISTKELIVSFKSRIKLEREDAYYFINDRYYKNEI